VSSYDRLVKDFFQKVDPSNPLHYYGYRRIVFRKFLHMIGYKCLWFGVKVKPEKAGGTSSTCPRCGSKLKEYPNRQVECLNCGYREDRDITACLNLLKASDVSLRFRLERSSDVAVNPALTSPKAMRKSWVSKRGEGISRRVTRTRFRVEGVELHGFCEGQV